MKKKDVNNQEKYYIQLFSIHGLIRSESLQLGHDADTGGQVSYVVDLAKKLSQSPKVRKVDILTRLISDKTVSEDYGKSVERVNDKCRIIRLRCGGRKYIKKELLWPFLEEFIDETIAFIKEENDIPTVFHGHYADAGYVAKRLSRYFGTPFIFTGHSLGRSKKVSLLESGMSEVEINRKFKIDHRIAIEEEILKQADLVIVSTRHEADEQYVMYKNHQYAEFVIVPPGLDLEKFHPFYYDRMPELVKNEREKFALASVTEEMNRFFTNINKPLILTVCRPAKKKNIAGLIKAYGDDKELQAIANLAIFAGIRKDISTMQENEKEVLTEMLLLMDKYDLYGKMAIPKKNEFEYEVPALYRIAAEKKGVFVNAAFVEPFGLTLIEASASGVPIITTSYGGPQDIIKNLQNGILVDPENTKEIAMAIKKIITNSDIWKQYSQNGVINVQKFYTWDAHVAKYLNSIETINNTKSKETFRENTANHFIGKRMAQLEYFLITDIDNTLIGENTEYLENLHQILQENHEYIGFGVATGRTIDSVIEYLSQFNLPKIDIFITSVGTEIYYGNAQLDDKGWSTHLDFYWDREQIRQVLQQFDFLQYQEEETQRRFKISYFMENSKDRLALIHNVLTKNRLKYYLIYSHDQYLDIIPYRASKGKALKYVSRKWNVPLRNIMTCGDSGNDEEMFQGETMGVVVGNYSKELEKLKGKKNVYFSNQFYTAAIIDGMKHYKLIEKARLTGGNNE